MRTSTISVTVIASVLMGSTPVSSLSTFEDRQQTKMCPLPNRHMISLAGSAYGIALVSPDRCSE
jgi:hypothetical protein